MTLEEKIEKAIDDDLPKQVGTALKKRLDSVDKLEAELRSAVENSEHNFNDYEVMRKRFNELEGRHTNFDKKEKAQAKKAEFQQQDEFRVETVETEIKELRQMMDDLREDVRSIRKETPEAP